MKKIIVIILSLFGFSSQAFEEVATHKSVIDDMRTMAINLKPEEVGLTLEKFPEEVFGVLMETGFENGTFTLLAIADGTTSLYFSNGGGIIGAGTHENVRKASAMLISGANHFHPQTKSASTYPYPSNGEVKFYLLGRKGITSYSAKEIDLGENRDPLSKLFYASHMVISELREIKDSENNN